MSGCGRCGEPQCAGCWIGGPAHPWSAQGQPLGDDCRATLLINNRSVAACEKEVDHEGPHVNAQYVWAFRDGVMVTPLNGGSTETADKQPHSTAHTDNTCERHGYEGPSKCGACELDEKQSADNAQRLDAPQAGEQR